MKSSSQKKNIRKLTRSRAETYFKLIKSADDVYWRAISTIENELQDKFGKDYELAIVDGSVIGIGRFTRAGRKLVFHNYL
jgi:hypothetical protein